MKYDIIIIGGGPAGATAAIYALRSGKKVLLLEKEAIGGKIITASLVENYPGIPEITGADLSLQLQEQIRQLGGNIQMKEVLQIKESNREKQVITIDTTYFGKAIIFATGTKYRTLRLENEEQLLGKGISFCATCDGFFFKNKQVAVIGGGNTAISNALELANICEKVYLIQNLSHLTAEAILVKRLQGKQNVEVLYHTLVQKWIGEERLEAIEIQREGKVETLKIDGAFLSIGQVPETEIVKPILKTNDKEYIITNSDAMTNQKGIFAAGDCVNKKIRQLTTAVSDGTVAALNAIEYLEHLEE